MHRSETVAAGVRSGAPSTAMDVVIRGADFEGYVVIDSIVDSRSAGGVRITGDLQLDEVRQLAAEMSLKYALFDLPRGGAKSGLRMDPALPRERRLAALEEFGHRMAPLIRNGIYSPGMDMNCGPDELRAIYRGAGHILGELTDTSYFTAISVHRALEAAAARLDVSGRPVRLAIEGFGAVACHLAERLDPQRFRIAAVSTIEGGVRGLVDRTPGELSAAKRESGDAFVHSIQGERTAREAVFTEEVDILLPSSRTGVFGPEDAQQARVAAIVPISNAPYRDSAVEILHDRGIQCLPGYLSNVGGVLASSLHDQGLSVEEVEGLFVSAYRPVVDGILGLADKTSRPATEVAEGLARSRMPHRPAFRERPLLQRVHHRFLRPRLPRSQRAAAAKKAFLLACQQLHGAIERGEFGA